MRKNLYQIPWLILLLIFIFTGQLFALDGNTNSHDPGALIKDGNKYWMFTTGAGIYAAYSEDLFQWTPGPKTVFPIGTWPEWINEAVPGFEGIFWAPECVYLNGRYYLYYSCSTFGSSRSAIGVASSPTLDQDSPDYQWTDHGMVVSSAVSTDVNAIDPAIFKDDDGRVYMSYGSFSGGIGVVELDPTTGKRKEGAAIKVVAGGENASWEAPYIFKEGAYYYMIVNRGFCCRGTNSTYYLVMGRSTNINGPYVDKAGRDLKNGGGTTVLGSSGKYIAPGHFGLLRENGWNYVSIHYYDGNDNGNPKLDIANMGFDNAGWPFITRDWIAAGRYKVTNQNSKLSWDSWGCSGREGEPLAQGPWADLECQQWDFTPVGNGVYTIKSAQSGRALSLTTTTEESCNTNWGAKLELAEPQNVDCQKFKIERTAAGAYIITSMASNLVVEVPWASLDPGVELIVWGHNGCNCQRWYINDPASPIVSKVSNTAPANNATVSYENLRLEWTGSAQSYNIYLGSAADKLVLKASNIRENAYSPGEALPLGEYYWRADAVLNGQTATGDVWSFTVEDKVQPTVMVKNISLPLNSDGSLQIAAEDVDDGSFDAYGIASLSLDKTSFDCSNLGENEVVLTVTDNNGNTATAKAIVQVKGTVPAPAISVSRTDNTFTGGDAHTIYLGYGAQALILTATDLSSEGASSYEWYPAAGLSSSTVASPTFAPTETGTYTFTVTATNEFGCAATAEVTITVIDVRCGNKSEKVQICHKGESICLDPVSVQDHLDHGCRLGDCINASNASRLTSGIDAQGALAEIVALDEERLTVYPNPAGSHATIAFSLPAADHYSLMLYDSNGKLLETLVKGLLSENEQAVFKLRTEKYTQGIYLLQLVTENEVISKRVLIQK